MRSSHGDPMSSSNGHLRGDVRVVPASINHVIAVAAQLRPEDAVETRAMADEPPLVSLMRGWCVSNPCFTGLVAFQPAAVGGFIQSEEATATATLWLVGTPMMVRRPKALCRAVRAFLAGAASHWRRVETYSHPSNTSHHRWLEWLGFDRAGSEMIGDTPREFYHYEMRFGGEEDG